MTRLVFGAIVNGVFGFPPDGAAALVDDGSDVPSVGNASFDGAIQDEPTPGSDRIVGDSGDNLLEGGLGDDTLLGKAGDDTLIGGDGSDYLSGGRGRDAIDYSLEDVGGDINLSTHRADFGEDSDRLKSIQDVTGSNFGDTMIGGIKKNLLDGGGGDDVLHGGHERDTLLGGDGDDLLHGNEDEDVLKGGAGKDFLTGDESDDRLAGNAGADGLYGGEGDDSIAGGGGDDALFGGVGNDTLFGGAGKNGVDGGDGDDVFHFGDGTDYVTTGTGSDVLMVARDGRGVQVGDFSVGVDAVQLDVADPGSTTVQQLIDDGDLKITGTDRYTLLDFGSSELMFRDIAKSDFSIDDVSLF